MSYGMAELLLCLQVVSRYTRVIMVIGSVKEKKEERKMSAHRISFG